MPDMRRKFFDAMSVIVRRNKQVMILTGDLGFSFYELFREEFPDHFINCGIAETNMIGVAAGLALAGKRPYVYSNSLFILGRAWEFVRDEVCYNDLPVVLCGTGAAGFLGFSHNMAKDEDKKILDPLPNIKQYYPEDEKQLVNILNKTLISKHPSYVRLFS